MKEEMQQAFEEAEYVAITSDGWTSITTESYMTITCHYVDEGHLCSCVNALHIRNVFLFKLFNFIQSVVTLLEFKLTVCPECLG